MGHRERTFAGYMHVLRMIVGLKIASEDFRKRRLAGEQPLGFLQFGDEYFFSHHDIHTLLYSFDSRTLTYATLPVWTAVHMHKNDCEARGRHLDLLKSLSALEDALIAFVKKPRRHVMGDLFRKRGFRYGHDIQVSHREDRLGNLFGGIYFQMASFLKHIGMPDAGKSEPYQTNVPQRNLANFTPGDGYQCGHLNAHPIHADDVWREIRHQPVRVLTAQETQREKTKEAWRYPSLLSCHFARVYAEAQKLTQLEEDTTTLQKKMQEVQENAALYRSVMLNSIIFTEGEWLEHGNVDPNMMVWKWLIEMKTLYQDSCLVAEEFGVKKPMHPFDTFVVGNDAIFLPDVSYTEGFSFDADYGSGYMFACRY